MYGVFSTWQMSDHCNWSTVLTTRDGDVFAVAAVVFIPTVMRTHVETVLVTVAADLVQPNRPTALAVFRAAPP